MPLTSISYSSYRDYNKCPLLFFYRRILKVKLPDDPIQLVLGKSFHLALEKMQKEKKDPVEVFKNDFTRDKVKQVSLDKFTEEKKEAMRLLAYWRDNHKALLKEAGFKIRSSEIPFELKVDKDPFTGQKLNLPIIRGVVDFDTTIDAIGDHKTSSKKYSQEMVDTSDQPTFYYLWHYLEKGYLPAEFIYIVYRKGIKKVPIQILRTTRTEEQVSELLTLLQKVVAKVHKKKYFKRHDAKEYFCDCYMYEKLLTV